MVLVPAAPGSGKLRRRGAEYPTPGLRRNPACPVGDERTGERPQGQRGAHGATIGVGRCEAEGSCAQVGRPQQRHIERRVEQHDVCRSRRGAHRGHLDRAVTRAGDDVGVRDDVAVIDDGSTA